MTRRGVALLLVLGTLLLVTTAVGTAMMAAATRTRSVKLSIAERRATDLLLASEAITSRWLWTEATRVVIDPALPSPRVGIADVRIDSDTRVRITAWDLQGMVPAGTPRSNPVGMALAVGLDAAGLEPGSLADLADPRAPVHPRANDTKVRLGGAVAVYPVRNSRLRTSIAPVINVNTAPEPLLRAALRTAERGDVDSILASRARGVPSPAPVRTREATGLVNLTGRSTLWAVRVDAEAGPITRSWWSVYQSRGRGWSIIDRHDIAD